MSTPAPPMTPGNAVGSKPGSQLLPRPSAANVVTPGAAVKPADAQPAPAPQRTTGRVTVVTSLYFTPGPQGGETKATTTQYEFPVQNEQPYQRTARLRPGVWTEAERGWLEAAGVSVVHLRAEGGPVEVALCSRPPQDGCGPALLLFAGETTFFRPAYGVRVWLRPLGGDKPTAYTLTAFPA